MHIRNLEIFWRSSKQKCVSLSSAESTYVDLSDVCKEVAVTRLLLIELNIQGDDGTIIHQDNQAYMDWATEGIGTRARYIDVGYHFCH